jgi:multiple sugar transport system substrate-binding protein
MSANTPRKNGLSRRDFLKSAGIGVAGVALSGALPSIAAPARQDISGSINYWHHFTSDSEFQGLEEVMKLFAKKYPNIKLTQENIPNADFMAKFTAAVSADTRPDTTMIAAERLADMNGMNGLIDITERVNSWELKKFFPDNRWEGISVDGKIYGIPAFTFVDWMYYRVDYFKEAGIEKPPTTLQEFQDAAIKLTDASKGRYGFGLRGGGGGQGFITQILEAYGSPIVVDGKAAIDKAKAIEAITFWSELYTKHKVVPPSAPNDSYRQIMEAFKTGQTAMVWHHSGSLAEIKGALGDKGDKFLSAVRPNGPVNSMTNLSYLYNGLMKTDNADAAWAWISFWGETDPTLAFLDKTGYFPASEAVATDKRITDDPYYLPAVAATKIGRLPPSFIGYSDWSSNVALPAFQKLLVGNATVEQTVDDMISGLEKALS